MVVVRGRGDAEKRGMVWEPRRRSLAVLRERNVPEMVVPGDPGVRVLPAMRRWFGAAVRGWLAMDVVVVKGDFVEGRGMVLALRRNWPAGLRERVVPEMVVAGAPGLRVCPAIAMAFGAAVMAWPAMVVVMGCGAGFARGSVLVPTMRAEDASWIGVPDTVIGGAPLVRVVPATAIAFGAAVMTWPAIVVVMELGPAEGRGMVDAPIMRADGPSCIGVPETVIGGAPGVKVVPAMEMP